MTSRFCRGSDATNRTCQVPAPARLQLTSLVDMMVILVVFLLMSFSVEGQLITPAADLDLPVSSAREPARIGVTIEVLPDRIRIDGQEAARAADLLRDDPAAVAALAARLADIEDSAATPTISVHCDRRVDFRLLGRVLRACGGQGLADVSLLVLEETP